MRALETGETARIVTYQLCRTRTDGGEVDLVLNLFVDRDPVSVKTIARLPAGDAPSVLGRCIALLEDRGIGPADDAIALARAA